MNSTALRYFKKGRMKRLRCYLVTQQTCQMRCKCCVNFLKSLYTFFGLKPGLSWGIFNYFFISIRNCQSLTLCAFTYNCCAAMANDMNESVKIYWHNMLTLQTLLSHSVRFLKKGLSCMAGSAEVEVSNLMFEYTHHQLNLLNSF